MIRVAGYRSQSSAEIVSVPSAWAGAQLAGSSFTDCATGVSPTSGPHNTCLHPLTLVPLILTTNWITSPRQLPSSEARHTCGSTPFGKQDWSSVPPKPRRLASTRLASTFHDAIPSPPAQMDLARIASSRRATRPPPHPGQSQSRRTQPCTCAVAPNGITGPINDSPYRR